MRLREVMHVHIPWLTAESTVRDAIDKMDVYQFPALVVLDVDKRPLAVVTEGDICRAVSKRDSFTALSNEPAIIYGSQDPVTASADTEISDAFHKMLSSGLTVLPVVEDGNMVGVVLRCDLMQAMLVDCLPSG